MSGKKELNVWKESMVLAKDILLATKDFPPDEKFGLVFQMRKCAVSIASNIAEGAGRSSDKEFSRFLDIAVGSSYELETQVLLALDFGYQDMEQTEPLFEKIAAVQRMLHGLKKSIDAKRIS